MSSRSPAGKTLARTRIVVPAIGALLLAGLGPARGAETRPWQRLAPDTTAAAAAAHFKSPPPEYSATITWGWDGPVTRDVIDRDLDTIRSLGLRAATVEAGYNMDNAPYLSNAWFELVRYAAEQARARDMRLWIIDEGKYPSGFAGGRFSAERPDLRMQALAAERIDVTPGETIVRPVGPGVLSVVAYNPATGEARLLQPEDGEVRWTAPREGTWQLLVTRHEFRTPQTRAVNDPTRAKTTQNSMGDLLNPEAVGQFIAWTHEGYARHLGEHLGTTVLGFRGDEPDFAGTPWTPGILDEFQRRKGYDVRPHLPFLVAVPRGVEAPRLTDEQRRAKADYWDVWSDLFARNFFAAQAKWCAAHDVEYMVHLNTDHDLFVNVRNSGHFFRNLRHVQIPGIDVIWSQVYPGRAPADFPKFASSAAHVYGHPRALSESFAAFHDPVTVDVARWVVNQQLVRGINLFEFMFFRASSPRPEGSNAGGGRMRYFDDPAFPTLAAYTNRAQYLLAQGRPAASLAVYAPITSFWLGEREANESLMAVARQLIEAQRDFDFVDDEALGTEMELSGGGFVNASGQRYRAVILPAVSVLSDAAFQRLREFARKGGRVVILGSEPRLVVAQSFLEATTAPDFAWAHREPSGEVTPAVLAVLPPPDVHLAEPCRELTYTHRQLADADVYFFFNEGTDRIVRTADLAGRGDTVQVWDANTGSITPLPTTPAAEGRVRITLELEPGESRFFVVGENLPPASNQP